MNILTQGMQSTRESREEVKQRDGALRSLQLKFVPHEGMPHRF